MLQAKKLVKLLNLLLLVLRISQACILWSL